MTPLEMPLAALGLTAVLALAVAGYLDRPMWRILVVGCGGKTPALFWSACFRVVLVAVPIAVQLFFAPNSPGRLTGEPVPDLIEYVKWGLVGEVAGVLLVAVGVGLAIGSRARPVWVDPEDADDLRRLVERVRLTRARELVEKAGGR
ncbi:MAG TPA: hypothetical protein VM533_18325 [Fimbriiglobus sp.]|nr:hypothetical protein [Fimbriiglobus sp.]